MHVQVTSMLKEHLVTADNWRLVHRIYRHAISAASNATTTRRSFQPRESSPGSSTLPVTVEDALGYRFKDKRIMETAITHSCASPRKLYVSKQNIPKAYLFGFFLLCFLLY